MTTFAAGHQGLRNLAALLRRPLPSFFVWDFGLLAEQSPTPAIIGEPPPPGTGYTYGCAIGLTRILWPDFDRLSRHLPARQRWTVEARHFGMTRKNYVGLFGLDSGQLEPYAYGRRSLGEIKPGDVAQAIDHYLATGSVE